MAKRSFLDAANPASMFMSNQQPEAPAPEAKAEAKAKPATNKASKKKTPAVIAPEGFKANPLYVETKSKRVQLLMQPSLLEAAKAEAEAQGISLNEFVSNIIRNALNGDKE